MNIAIFTDTYYPKIDGIAVSVDNFARELEKRGYHFIIFAPRYTGTSGYEKISDNIEIYRFHNTSLPSYPDVKISLPSQRKIHKVFSALRPDILHIQTSGFIGQYGYMLSRMYKIPLVGTYHTMMNEMGAYISPYRLLKIDRIFNRFRRGKKIKKNLETTERKNARSLTNRIILRMTNRLYSRSAVVISPSHLIKKELEETGVKSEIVVISNGLDLSVFKGDVKKFPGSAPSLLHVGRISFEKNVNVLLRAFAIIHEKIPGATFTIVGDGPALPSLRLEVKRLKLQEVVHFTGFLPRAELPALYPKYDLFFTASTMETQGLVVLEAIASGLPAVGVDAYALPELIQHSKNGFIAAPGNSREIAEYVIDILKDRELYEKFSREGLKIAAEHDFHVSADKLDELYQRIAGKIIG